VPGGGSQRLGQTKGLSGTGAGGGPSAAAGRGIERGRTEHGDVRAGLGGGMAASGSAGRGRQREAVGWWWRVPVAEDGGTGRWRVAAGGSAWRRWRARSQAGLRVSGPAWE
jgi:hypothetical protein